MCGVLIVLREQRVQQVLGVAGTRRNLEAQRGQPRATNGDQQTVDRMNPAFEVAQPRCDKVPARNRGQFDHASIVARVDGTTTALDRRFHRRIPYLPTYCGQPVVGMPFTTRIAFWKYSFLSTASGRLMPYSFQKA